MRSNPTLSLKAVLSLGTLASLGIILANPVQLRILTQTWFGTGGNPQHTGVSNISAQPMTVVKWSTPIDLFPQSATSAHYSGPGITAKNTVCIGVKTGESDGFRVEGHKGTDGSLLYRFTTDYSLAVTNSTSWTGMYPISLVNQSLVGAGGGGTVFVKSDADNATSPITNNCFYQPYATYAKNPAAYSAIKISTPITGSKTGDFFFGYRTFDATIPAFTKVGYGGIVKMNTSGASSFVLASKLVPSVAGDVVRPDYNSSPVVSNDGTSIYAGITNATQGIHYLVKLAISNLARQAYVRLKDPVNNLDVFICTCSSASPMVAPDDQVFYGVLRNNDATSHGWMLQFDKNLKQTDSKGKRFPIGAFGWDDTPSVVPSSAVKAYKGTSPYLLLTKYNNYAGTGGNGRNRLAILDPKDDSKTIDYVTGSKQHTMNEVLTVLGITCDSEFYACTPTTNTKDPSVPVREWCINAAAIDPATRSAIVNSEDGHAYRWDFDTNKLIQGIKLQPATGEPYTSTAIGPDGTSYVINNATLHALAASKKIVP